VASGGRAGRNTRGNGERQLAQVAIAAVAQHGGVSTSRSRPTPSVTEQRDDMRVVAGIAVHVHEERRLAADPQRAGGDERAFDAMRASLPQHFPHRHGVAVRLMVDRDGVTNPDRCGVSSRARRANSCSVKPGGAAGGGACRCGHHDRVLALRRPLAEGSMMNFRRSRATVRIGR
jgi:hypothetical protein